MKCLAPKQSSPARATLPDLESRTLTLTPTIVFFEMVTKATVYKQQYSSINSRQSNITYFDGLTIELIFRVIYIQYTRTNRSLKMKYTSIFLFETSRQKLTMTLRKILVTIMTIKNLHSSVYNKTSVQNRQNLFRSEA